VHHPCRVAGGLSLGVRVVGRLDAIVVSEIDRTARCHEQQDQDKKRYRKPSLRRLGAVAALTAGGSGHNRSGQSGMMS
jgi:hypothetical protein